jgi:hypothetical protein
MVVLVLRLLSLGHRFTTLAVAAGIYKTVLIVSPLKALEAPVAVVMLQVQG